MSYVGPSGDVLLDGDHVTEIDAIVQWAIKVISSRNGGAGPRSEAIPLLPEGARRKRAMSKIRPTDVTLPPDRPESPASDEITIRQASAITGLSEGYVYRIRGELGVSQEQPVILVSRRLWEARKPRKIRSTHDSRSRQGS